MPPRHRSSAHVRLQVWRVAPHHVPAALLASRVTAQRLRHCPAATFSKVLGTASSAFVPRAATPSRWAVLTCWRGDADEAPTRWWDRHAEESAALSLRPLWSRGTWDGARPFEVGADDGWAGPVASLTRAALRLRRAREFYRAVPAVAADLTAATGCRVAIGIGEAPLLRQGTVSVWDSHAALRAFADAAPAHMRVVTATPIRQWYAEELFARFAVLDATGSIDGKMLG